MSDADDEVLVRAKARIGAVLKGKYRLDRVLGIGGMAVVYAATHRNKKRVAIKMLHPELSIQSDVRARFLREGYVANSVEHAGAVSVLDDDVGEDGAAFLVMELLDGEGVESLWERRQYRLPIDAVLGIGHQLLDVLAAAHARGIVHRDIKPANLFITTEGQLKVLDFGIARLREAASRGATHTGSVLGTPAFMAPEQALGDTRAIDAQTDVWAVGATLFTLATGRFVHEADNAQRAMVMAATTPAPTLGIALPGVRAEIVQLVDCALAYDKRARWPSAAAMRDALARASHAVLGAVPTREALAAAVGDRDMAHARTAASSPNLAALASAPHESRPNAPPPLVGTMAAQPVSRSGAGPSPQARRTRMAVVAGGSAAAVLVATVAFVVLRAAGAVGGSQAASSASEAATTPAPSASAAAANVGATPAAPATSAAELPALASAQPQPAPAPQPPRRTATSAAAKPSATAAPKRNCNPPYEVDKDGNKLWKRECL